MTTEHEDPPELQAPLPRIPRMGAAASGLVALLLVGGMFVIPFLGLFIAPLGSLPVLHFQSGGAPGYRAWGPVVALLVVAGLAVVMGAFGAHGVDSYFAKKYEGRTHQILGKDIPTAEKFLDDYKTAAK